ncbi:MAG: hypothetical protein GXO39_01745 [Thermotogae bacterium]|nr:hypothetical protein [Thermotogota bacterium]
MKLITCEYGDKFYTSNPQKCGDQGTPLFHIAGDGHSIKLKYGESGEEFPLKEGFTFKKPPDDRNSDDYKESARLLGLHPEQQDNALILKAHWFVGITRIPVKEGELILQVKPKIENLDSSRMLIDVLSHPEVSRHVEWGKMYEILTDQPPVEVEDVPADYLLFLLIHYMKVLYDLTRRGLRKGYRRKEENLRGRVRGRILVGRTIRENWFKGRRHYVYSSFNEYSTDTLENRILKAAFLKARSYLLGRFRTITGEIASWTGRIGVDMEGVSTTRIYPTDFLLTTVQRIRPDYKKALGLARYILQALGYDPTVETYTTEMKVHPYWIDMNELFERYVEVKLRKEEIKDLKGWRVFPGYGWKEGIKTDIKGVGELRPDFVLVNGNEIAIGDAKYKEDYKEGWIREDLQQIALYGRIKWEKIRDWIGKRFGQSIDIEYNDQKNDKDCPGREPKLYIFYPCPKNSNECSGNSVEAGAFRCIYKIGVKVPVRQSNSS